MSRADRTYASGDPWKPSAEQFNFWTQGGRAAQSSTRRSPPPGPAEVRETVIRVVNATESDLPEFALVACRDLSITADDDEPQFLEHGEFEAVLTPADDADYFFVVLKQALAPEQSGLAVLVGVTPVRITGDGEFAAPTEDEAYLTAGNDGWKILYQQAGSSERWALIALTLDSPQRCVNVYYIESGIGNITGSFTWYLRLISDRSVVTSGTFTIGTHDVTTIKTAIDSAIGGGFDLLATGGLPGTIELHPNRGRRWTSKYEIWVPPSGSLTASEEGFPAYVSSSSCCIVGG